MWDAVVGMIFYITALAPVILLSVVRVKKVFKIKVELKKICNQKAATKWHVTTVFCMKKAKTKQNKTPKSHMHFLKVLEGYFEFLNFLMQTWISEGNEYFTNLGYDTCLVLEHTA